MKKHPGQVQTLTRFRQAIQEVPQYGIHILTILPHFIDAAAAVCQQHGLLSNDALIVAIMQANGLTNLASNDPDFDRVPGLMRYAPV
jgi:predicted nucleic acid-binding protein